MNTGIENYTTVKDEKLYQQAFLNFTEREIGELSEEKPLEFYIDNFNKLEEMVNQLLAKIESEENKGSFLSHLENLKNELITIEGVGDVEKLYTKVSNIEVELNEQIRQNRERNLAVKKAFIEELSTLSKEGDLTLVVERVKDIRAKWIRVGAVDKSLKEELNDKFTALCDAFFSKYNEVIEEELVEYKNLLKESEELIDSEDKKEAKKRIIEIQQEWKMLPKIPKNEFVPLFNQLRAAHDTFFNKLKEGRDARRGIEFEKNLEVKNDIINKAKKLLTNIESTTIKDLKQVQENWKKSGRVEEELNDKLWNDFSVICEKIFELKMLDIQVAKFYKGDKKNSSEIVKFKIKELQNSIRKEEQKLKTVEDNLGAFRLNISSKKMENQFLSKDKNIERKLNVKKDLIEELKAQLEKA